MSNQIEFTQNPNSSISLPLTTSTETGSVCKESEEVEKTGLSRAGIGTSPEMRVCTCDSENCAA
jgi:hypothetical protein